MPQPGNTLYRILPDDSGWGSRHRYLIDATHAYGLPGVRCEVCSAIWSDVGLSYPSINLECISPLPEGPVDMGTWDGIEMQARQLIPAHYPIRPGTEFGPLGGRLSGKVGDFMWVNTWTPLVKKEVYEKFLAEQIEVIGVEASLKHKRDEAAQLVELEADPSINLSRSVYPPELFDSCSGCGRMPNMKKLERLVIDARSIPASGHIFRIIEFSTVIVVSKGFYEEALNNKFSNIVFIPVEVD